MSKSTRRDVLQLGMSRAGANTPDTVSGDRSLQGAPSPGRGR